MFQDCDSDYHGNWTCLPGLHGGFDPGTFVTNNCSYEPQLFDTDWNSILCLVKSRSSYLGMILLYLTNIGGRWYFWKGIWASKAHKPGTLSGNAAFTKV